MNRIYKKFVTCSFFVVGLMIALNAFLFAAEEHAHGEPLKTFSEDPYYLTTCPVTGQALGSMGKPVVYNHDGREIRFCCSGCVEQFKKEPQKFIDKVDKAMIKDQLPHYPLETCLVTKQKLTAMGKAVDLIYKNRLVRFCCSNCVTEFTKNPEPILNQLNEATIKKQKDDYPIANCIASGEKLGGSMGKPIDVVIANRLIRLCCPSCQKMLQENPSEYLSKLDKADGTHDMKKDNHADHSGHQH
ncbi:MAG: hypothetical protein P9L94_11670 [Candidatus Hinthialibacter antarcticus]|nr:hypothetical protein [Candidatus Hinthialibacter antarcticus]